MAEHYRRTIWDYWAPRYHRLYVQKVSLGPSRRLMHAHIAETAPEATRFLDLGCGIGQFARELAEQHPNASIVAIDPTQSMVERAKREFDHPHISYLMGTVHDVPHSEGFDVITCMHAFPYVRDPDAVASRMQELLRPGGRTLILGANWQTIWDRIVLWFVGLTTTKARYRSTQEIGSILKRAGLENGAVKALPKRWFMASINLVEGLK